MKNRLSFRAVAGAILFCVLFLCVKNAATPYMSKIDSGMPAMERRQTVQDLYIGSSLFRKGIDPYTLDQTGRDYFIVVYNANQPVFEYQELKAMIDKGCKCDRVYIDLYPYTIVREPWISDTRLLYDTSLMEKINIWNAISSTESADFSTWWEFFVTSNNGLFVFNPIYQRLVRSHYYHGVNPQEEVGLTEEEAKALDTPQFESLEFNLLQKKAIEDMITLCKDNNIDIAFVETPKYPVMAEFEDYRTVMNKLIELVIACGGRVILHENTLQNYIASGNSDTDCIASYQYDNALAENYLDTLHMSSKGRTTFTKALATLESTDNE